MISVLIPTRNEELNLPACLDSIDWSDDIHVYDNGSTDRTLEIARNAKVHCWQSPASGHPAMFGGNEAEHRNWALANIPFKYEWVLLIDADERVTPDLAKNIEAAIQSPGQAVAFLLQRRDFFMGRWLKHVQATRFYLRLFRPEKMRYQRLINPISVADGPVSKISGYLDHFPFSKGIEHWLARHNAYSSLEAAQIETNQQRGEAFSFWNAIFSHNVTERRLNQKNLFYRLPARPLVKFIFLYVAKRGFMDGRAGFAYAALQSIYEYMIILKTRELKTREPSSKKHRQPETAEPSGHLADSATD